MSSFIQWNIGMPLEAILEIPIGLTMAPQNYPLSHF
jgi:hypothetical protein